MTHQGECCTHCGSFHVQEARRTDEEITFRCLHCWKLFPRSTATTLARIARDDDAA